MRNAFVRSLCSLCSLCYSSAWSEGCVYLAILISCRRRVSVSYVATSTQVTHQHPAHGAVRMVRHQHRRWRGLREAIPRRACQAAPSQMQTRSTNCTNLMTRSSCSRSWATRLHSFRLCVSPFTAVEECSSLLCRLLPRSPLL